MSKIPIIVIGGFLGCGKTSALNHFLQDPMGRKFAVIVNDIGAVNIDAELIHRRNQRQIELTNGCICCSLQSDLFDAVTNLVGESGDFDAILIEASGVANPGTLVASLKLLEDAAIARTETLVYLIDADGFAQLDFEDAERVLDNAALSDLLVINKQDLVAEAELNELYLQLDDVAPGRHRLLTSFGRIPAALLFAPADEAFDRQADLTPGIKANPDHHGYSEQTILRDRPLERECFDEFAASVAEHAWRAKGFVRFSQQPEQVYLFNQVGRRATLEPYDAELLVDRYTIRLVLIGRDSQLPLATPF